MSSKLILPRREFLRQSAIAAATLPAIARSVQAQNPTPVVARPQLKNSDWRQPSRPLRGVNLGAWLVLEKWMTPSVFMGTEAGDEWSFSQTAGAREKLEKHRATWITEADFAWIAARGLDAVRIPVGFWTLENVAPYVSAATHLDNAFAWAQKHKLQVLVDLHGAQGSQNGWDHSGHSGEIGWTKPENIAASVRSLEILAERYGKHPNLWGIECLNEPRWDVPLETLKSFYQTAYKTMRKHLPEDRAVVIHDGFRPHSWASFMGAPEYQNVVLDTHIYQAYTDADRQRSPENHIRNALDRAGEIDKIKSQLWTIVGEWSNAIAWDAVKDLPAPQRDVVSRGYGAAQLLSHQRAHGWFYWSLKTENGGDWSLQDSVERGLMPDNFAL